MNLVSPKKILIDNHEERKMNQSFQHCNKKSNSDEDNQSEIVDWVDHTKYYKWWLYVCSSSFVTKLS